MKGSKSDWKSDKCRLQVGVTQTQNNMKNFFRRIRSVWYPDRYHGWGRNASYFEGWYFKIVDPTEQYAFAVIPGIAIDPEGKRQAFIQRLDGKAGTAAFHEFEASAFQPEADRFAVRMAENLFTANELQLDLPELRGKLQFDNLYPWPKMLGAPGIMGWYSFVPFMECKHGIGSVLHDLKGSLRINNSEINFSDGTGYIEKDWGTSFPESWIWLHCNTFNQPGISFTFSVAKIPWLGSFFMGHICFLYFEGKFYSFATYNGSKITKLKFNKPLLEIEVSNKNYTLKIKAKQNRAGNLKAPVIGEMNRIIKESVDSEIEISLFDKKDKLILNTTGNRAGLEIIEKILSYF
jgi:hypothetical protein